MVSCIQNNNGITFLNFYSNKCHFTYIINLDYMLHKCVLFNYRFLCSGNAGERNLTSAFNYARFEHHFWQIRISLSKLFFVSALAYTMYKLISKVPPYLTRKNINELIRNLTQEVREK